MKDKKIEVKSGGLGLCSALTVLFAAAKLFGHFPYSWWIVFLPVWGPIVVVLGIVAVALVIGLIAVAFK